LHCSISFNIPLDYACEMLALRISILTSEPRLSGKTQQLALRSLDELPVQLVSFRDIFTTIELAPHQLTGLHKKPHIS
jgi:hypothetical protein